MTWNIPMINNLTMLIIHVSILSAQYYISYTISNTIVQYTLSAILSNRKAFKLNQETEQKTLGQSEEFIRYKKSFQLQAEIRNQSIFTWILWSSFWTPHSA